MRPGQKIPFVIICHGLTGNAQEAHLTSVADSLEAHGIGSIRFNFNGHGDDKVNFSKHTISKEISEVYAIYDYVSKLPRVDKKRIGITGHSQGGFVAGVAAGELGSKKIASLCMLAPAAFIHTMSVEKNVWGTDCSDMDFHALKAAADADLSAPQGIPLWGAGYLGWEYLIDAAELDPWTLAARYDGPAGIVQGTADVPALYRDSKKYCEHMPGLKFCELEGLSHCYPEDLPLAAHTACEFFVQTLL